jgi:endonuclease/exonuclease/phosphatase family metal-dependent hydrolase
MYSKILIKSAIFLAVSAIWVSGQYSSQIKVLSYNLWGYQNAVTPGGYDSLADVINEIDPDISGHQEVDSANDRSGGIDVIGYLGEQTNMHAYYAPALIGWGGGHYGEGLLADSAVISQKNFWVEQIGGEDRSALEVEITMAGKRVRILTTHLAHENDEFAAHQAEEMVTWMDEQDNRDIPMIIMGDFNSVPGDTAMTHYGEAGFVYVNGSNGQPLDRIDHIMYRPESRWRVVEAEKPTHYEASDHDPVWALMELLPDPTNVVISMPSGKLKSSTEKLLGTRGIIIKTFVGKNGDIILYNVKGITEDRGGHWW